MSKLAARILISSVLFSIGLIFSSESVYGARSVKIDSFEDSFHNDEEGEVQVSLIGFDEGEEIRVKGAFAGDGSTNYFGFTKIGGEWIKNSTKSEDQPVVNVTSWDYKLKIKPDPADSGFHGTDDYNFKIGFYYLTAGGNLSSVNWSEAVKVHIDFVPSPTPLPTILPTSTSVIVPTAIPTSTPKAITKINPTIAFTPTKIISPLTKENPPTGKSILSGVTALPGIGEVSSNDGEISGSADKILGINDRQKTKSSGPQIVAGILMTGAVICFIISIFFSIRIIKRREKREIPL
ncbi:hypothetical protein A3D03_02335 [Candidatus Gottesmanbacteria bacterium RIFCSPHIGHO2_02_FULL_40_13]|uniref:Uncharacterized protein n=1 Tax=Candidatus Gottesmanbacteria bacterium RIFCSPHIGHO2_02_FULL_40_13 TaxID=1798384 RepID=A0A1F6A9X0_9BACT|nr:MAG: hypothetical protein A3D03_02335 [Candidatus Gottesmanbacteria bacterium RIFCSPHIGHO2_02_FULL_40_13]